MAKFDRRTYSENKGMVYTLLISKPKQKKKAFGEQNEREAVFDPQTKCQIADSRRLPKFKMP